MLGSEVGNAALNSFEARLDDIEGRGEPSAFLRAHAAKSNARRR
jgi:hypothetical protein